MMRSGARILTVAIALIVVDSAWMWAQETNLATALMTSTIKIEAQGSLGTGFLLGQPLKTDPSRAAYILITAAHVLAEAKGDVVVLHLRSKVGDGFERLLTPLVIRAGGKPLWVQHPTADVAAMRVRVPEAAHVVLALTNLLATDETLRQLAVGPGEELLVLGFPFGAESSTAGFPILRSGRIASYPLLPTKDVKTFLMDFQVFKGNSGGPVFLMASALQRAGGVSLGRFLSVLGLVSQEQEIKKRIQSLTEVTERTHRLALADLQEYAMQSFVSPATLTPEKQEGGFVVTFADVPEAITQGDDVTDALQQAADCLEEAIAGRLRRHESIPLPSPVGPDHYAIPLPAQTAAKAALYCALRQAHLTQVELAARLQCDEKEVRRLLDPRHASKLARLEAALAVLGHQLVVGMQVAV